MDITAHGKLLLTGEYFVLDGAWALALPVRYAQRLRVEPDGGAAPHSLRWESRDSDESIWFSAEYALPSLQVSHTDDAATANTLAALLLACRRQCPDFLCQAAGLKVLAQTDFPRAWGLGTSSTLIASLGRWSGADPYAVLFETLGGSGYDVACAFAEGPILYRLAEGKPQVEAVAFAPPFAERLYFAYLGKKQDSREGIRRYRERAAAHAAPLTDEVSELTHACLRAQSLADFEAALAEHERLIAQSLGLTRAKDLFFKNFWGEVKSLGAWGGDFVLVSSERGEAATRRYFQEKGFGTLLTWKAMMG
jgi:mevalonate kinase